MRNGFLSYGGLRTASSAPFLVLWKDVAPPQSGREEGLALGYGRPAALAQRA
jgi:hypothetical protein